MQFSRLPRFFLGALAVATIGACADDPNVPPGSVPVGGQYHATTFTISPGGSPVNLLALGTSLVITLAPDHTTSGRLIVPAVVTGEEALDEDLAGTWRQSHDTVFFSQTADTFIRDVPFVVHGSALVGQIVDPEGRVDVTLDHYPPD